MKINFLTLFPSFYQPFINESIVKRAIDKEIVSIDVINFRNFSFTKNRNVDDEIYGGGQGMLLKVEPIDLALQKTSGIKILVSPQGKVFNQKIAKRLAQVPEITFISGRYEGFDERVRQLVDFELSIGDYILTGGELPSMVIAESIIRLLPGVIKSASKTNDSLENNLLDYPQYTRPREYKNMKVPEVLLSGNHMEIKKWRIKMALKNTKLKRPDLLKGKKDEK